MMRAVNRCRTTSIVLCILACHVLKVAAKTLQEDNITEEVTLKIHLSDANTQQPLGGATVELFANHTSVATETSSPDGNVHLRFPYRLGTPLVVTATKQGYVPNSAPWAPARLPVFSSLSLDLLPERAATLMVYDDVVQIVSGFQGWRGQPWVQFQRRALSLPPNASYTNLTALFTVASSPTHIQHFPYLQGLGSNATGTEKSFKLTPVVAISVHLLAGEGVELQVSEPISISVPLPADSGLKENDHIPAWRFDPRLGAWLKSSLGYVQRDGHQLCVTYIAPQFGYWVAAMSPLHTGPEVTKDISMYHTVFLLAILGGMALILLCLLCLLLYTCRRRCLKPRGSHRKLHQSSGVEGSQRDQATSMSHLNLISSETQLELVSTATDPDMTTPMLKPSSYEQHDNQHAHGFISHGKHSRSSLANNSRHGSSLSNLTPRSRDCRHSAETFQLKAPPLSAAGFRQSYTSVCSSTNQISEGPPATNRALASASRLSGVCVGTAPSSPSRSPSGVEGGETRPPDYLLSRSVDHLERPAGPSLSSRPGQLLCCGSVDLLSGAGEGYPRVRPTLVIPAHYMRLPGEHPLCGQALLLQTDQQSDLETLQAELNASHSQQPLGPQSPSSDGSPGPPKQGGGGSGEGLSMSDTLSIPTGLGDAAFMEINVEDTLLAEKNLMELRGGKPLPHPRAWFVSLDGRSNAHIRHSYIDLQRAGCHGNTPGAGGRRGGGGRRRGIGNDTSLDSGVDLNEPRGGRRGRELEGKGVGRGGAAGGPLPADKAGVQRGDSEEGSAVGRVQIQEVGPSPSSSTSSASPASPPPPPAPDAVTFRTDSPLASPDDGDEAGEEEKKSPWQRREERPLLAFNLK